MENLTRRATGDRSALPLHAGPAGSTLAPRRAAPTSVFASVFASMATAVTSLRLRHLALCAVQWLAVLYYFERVQPAAVIRSCRWGAHDPDAQDADAHTADAHHIALLADPQLVDDYSYPGRPRLANYFAKKFTDNYLHRNYMLQKRLLQPDTIMFLGDLFDGGREWDDAPWLEEYRRFNRVFPRFPDTGVVMSLPGNHDIGFGNDVNVSRLDRFRTYFGESNDYVVAGGYAVVMLDTIALSSDDPRVNAEPRAFLRALQAPSHDIKNYPTVLLTHVPLYRFTDRQHCGPLRESPAKFPVQKGRQYQTVLDYELSQQLLQAVQPVLVFSGDDHDYCDVSHSYSVDGDSKVAREVTIKSVAMSAGIRYPAMQLLSLRAGTDAETSICYLPTPATALACYALLAVAQVASFAVLFLAPGAAAEAEARVRRFWRVPRVPRAASDLPVTVADEKLRPAATPVAAVSRIAAALRAADWHVPASASGAGFVLHASVAIAAAWLLILRFFNTV